MNRSAPRIVEVPVPGDFFAKQQIGVCLFQLHSFFTADKGEIIFLESADIRRQRINSLLFGLLNNKELIDNLDIIVFPEYSSPLDNETSNIFLKFSKTSNKIVCSCSYDMKTRRSMARIFVPWDNEPITQPKLSESHYEAGLLSPVSDEEHLLRQFTWVYEGKTYAMRFYLCLDFLLFGADKALLHPGPTINIVSMASPTTRPFYGLSDYLMRSPTGFFSTVTLLCNATASKEQTIGLRAGGESGIVGPTYVDLPPVPMYEEAGLMCSISVGNILERRTSLTRPNYVISNVGLVPVMATGASGPVRTLSGVTYTVNPNVILKDMQYGKFYAFYSTAGYAELCSAIEKTANEYRFPIGTHGVFGKHDIMFTSHDIDKEFFTLRLQHYLGPCFGGLEAEEKKNPSEYYEVTQILKFRGQPLPDYEMMGEEFIKEHVGHMQQIANRGMLNNEIIKDLLENNVIIAVESSSDVTARDREEGSEEYLVVVFLLAAERIEEAKAIEEFKNKVLSQLMTDNRVRTIEYCKQKEVDAYSSSGQYILHVVGKLADLRDVIIGKIHAPLVKSGIRCGSRVIPPAETIIRDTYRALSETYFRAKEVATITRKVVDNLKPPKERNPEKDPFLIRELPIDTLKGICLLYKEHKNYVRALLTNPDIRSVLGEENFEESICKFIFAVMYGTRAKTQVTEAVHLFFEKYCGEAYGGTMKQVEKILNQERYRIKSVMLELDNSDLKLSYENKLGPELAATIYAATSVLGNQQRLIAQWNTKVAKPEHRTIDPVKAKNFIDGVNKLSLPIRMRNLLTHDYYENAPELQQTESRKFAADLLEAAIWALDFVKKVLGAKVRD